MNDNTNKLSSQLVKVSPIEDGNFPNNELNQGFIYTSESIDDTYYDTEYSSPILSVTSNRSKTNVGFVYEIVVEYTVKEAPTATSPGLYGSNLIKIGDFFTITSFNDSHDYIKGFVVNIIDVTVNGPIADTYTYEYNLLCNISEGDPLLIESNDSFVWKRRIFTDKSNNYENIPPVQLLSTVKDDGVYFRWEDLTDRALKYNLRIREKNMSDGGNISYYKVTGKNSLGNNEMSLSLFIGLTGGYEQKISCVKIQNPGSSYSITPIASIIGTGTGASAELVLDDNGSLRKDLFLIYDSNSLDEIKIRSYDWKNDPLINTFVEGLSEDLFIDSVVNLDDNLYSITLRKVSGEIFTFNSSYFQENMLHKKILIHNGAQLKNTGNGYRRNAYVKFKEFSKDDVYYIKKGLTSTNNTILFGDYAWSVCGIFSNDNKEFSEWSPEYDLSVK